MKTTVSLPAPRIVDVRASLAFDGSFASYDQALAHVQGPRLTNSVDFIWNQGLLDVLLEYPIQSDRSQFSIYSKLSSLALSTTTSLRFLPPDGTMHTFEFTGNPDLIRLDPTWYQVAARFVKTGFHRILYGQDYWLFLLALAIPLRRWRALIPVVTAFAVAEAITLSPSSNLSLDTLWFQPLIGLLIASSIIYMAIENAMGTGISRRWMIAFGFGLLLGFHFSFGLRPALQFAGAHAMTSLLAFGAGVAAGQNRGPPDPRPRGHCPGSAARRAGGGAPPVAGGGPYRVALDGRSGRAPEPVSISMAGGHSGTDAGELGNGRHHCAGRFLGAVDDCRANRGGRAGCRARYCERGAVRLSHAEAGTSIQ